MRNDAGVSTNYPIARFKKHGSNKVTYGRTFDFSSLGIATGSAPQTASMTVPPALAAGQYDLVVTTARLLTLNGSHETQVRGLSEAWRRVTSRGVPVAVVRDNPEFRDPSQNPNLCLAKVSVAEANSSCAMSRAANLDRWFDALREAQRRTPGTAWIDLSDRMCTDNTCPVLIGGVNVYSDGNHLTVTFARTLAPYLYRALVTAHLLATRPQKS